MGALTLKASTRVSYEFKSAWTTSTPFSERAMAVLLEGLRVMARMEYVESLRKAETTLEPWPPVAPTTAMICFWEVGIL